MTTKISLIAFSTSVLFFVLSIMSEPIASAGDPHHIGAHNVKLLERSNFPGNDLANCRIPGD